MLHMLEYSYVPRELEVAPGATILAMNFGPQDQDLPREQWSEYVHSVTATDGSFDLQAIRPDGTPHPFPAPTTEGRYPYYCRYHGDAQGNGMTGTLLVREPPATTNPAPTPTATPTPTPAPTADPRAAPTPAIAAIGALAIGTALLARRG